MKHLITWMTAAVIALTNCTTKHEPQAQNAEANPIAEVTVATDNVVEQKKTNDAAEWTDTLHLGTRASVAVHLYVAHLPSVAPAAHNSIRLWIAQLMDCEDTTSDMQYLLESLGRTMLTSDSAEIAQLLDEDALSPTLNYEHDMQVKAIYADKQYLTLCCTWYHFQGGAHGGTAITCTTFDKQTGHQYGWDLLEGMTRSEMGHAIKQALTTYFRVADETALRDYLLLGSDDESAMDDEQFPLPGNPPYLNAKGVNVIYQQYEIAPYAAGTPNGVVRSANADTAAS